MTPRWRERPIRLVPKVSQAKESKPGYDPGDPTYLRPADKAAESVANSLPEFPLVSCADALLEEHASVAKPERR
jgi:hypothetical protein